MTHSKNSARRLRIIHDALFAAYGQQHWWPARTRFEIILGAYLTQNTAWTSVTLSLANLRTARALTVAVGKAHCGRTARCTNCPLAHDLQPSHSFPDKPILKLPK